MRWSEEEYTAYRDKQRKSVQPPEMDEKTFLARVLRLAKEHGYSAYHTHNSKRSAAGFPDVVFLRPPSALRAHGRLIFAELKTAKGKLSIDQHRWLDMLRTVPGIECYLWRPHDWATIVAILTERPAP